MGKYNFVTNKANAEIGSRLKTAKTLLNNSHIKTRLMNLTIIYGLGSYTKSL